MGSYQMTDVESEAFSPLSLLTLGAALRIPAPGHVAEVCDRSTSLPSSVLTWGSLARQPMAAESNIRAFIVPIHRRGQ